MNSAPPRLALALSGGGARALAFHLGCLRGLRNAGLLDHVEVMSSVSGGSVLAALYCSTPGDFEAFERAARAALRRGMVRPALLVAVTSLEGVKVLAAFSLLLTDRLLAFVVGLVLRPWPSLRRRVGWLRVSPIRRFASRTTILRRAFDRLFAHRALADLRADRPHLVIIACELRAKAAIYFTRQLVQCWRYGQAPAAEVKLATAVAASAAYPAFLPALDERMTFTKDGQARVLRITLTDGGVYDNLGLAPFWPDRDTTISMPVPAFDGLVVCRAGYGLAVGDPTTFFSNRMRAVVESIHSRAQNLATARLHDLAAAKRLTFLLPYLGQDDSKLTYAPPNLVRREAVADYPTDFSAMSDIWIDRLVGRGETLVQALLDQYWTTATIPVSP